MAIAELTLKNGHVTLVDNDIAKKYRSNKLCMTSGGYAAISLRSKVNKEYLHRAIMNPEKGMVVDHINGDKLDNRRRNLKICSYSENLLNRRGIVKTVSGFRHVYIENRKYYRVRLQSNYRMISFGTYRSKYIAGIFADDIFVKKVGAFVVRNYPNQIPRSMISKFIELTKGKIFRVVFSRRSDGVQREMLCRTGVHYKNKSGKLPFDPLSRGLCSVYDVRKKSYRFIPLENVICIKFKKKNILVVD